MRNITPRTNGPFEGQQSGLEITLSLGTRQKFQRWWWAIIIIAAIGVIVLAVVVYVIFFRH